MPVTALLFGSIGAIAETSHMQRAAFNAAFRDSGLDWQWDRDEYRELLKSPGGCKRIADYATARGQDIDADAVYARKVAAFQAAVQGGDLAPRDGVVDMVKAALDRGITIGFVTGTSTAQRDLILNALNDALPRAVFKYLGHGGRAAKGKPAPDIYLDALAELDVSAGNALAIEDTPESARAALAAGIACVAFPGEDAMDRDFPDACITAPLTLSLLG